MDRVFKANVNATPPAAPASPASGYPQNTNLVAGEDATIPGAYWFHQITEEIRQVLVDGGVTPDHLDLTQLSAAILALIAANGEPNASETVTGIVELATAAETITGTDNTRAVHPAGLKATVFDNPNIYSKQQQSKIYDLTDGPTIPWDLDAKPKGRVTLGGNRTLANPSNIVDGGTYVLIVKQDATGGRTLAFDTAYEFPGGVAPVLSTAANARDILTFVADGGTMCCVAQKDFQ